MGQKKKVSKRFTIGLTEKSKMTVDAAQRLMSYKKGHRVSQSCVVYEIAKKYLEEFS